METFIEVVLQALVALAAIGVSDGARRKMYACARGIETDDPEFNDAYHEFLDYNKGVVSRDTLIIFVAAIVAIQFIGMVPTTCVIVAWYMWFTRNL
ncbi:MAG: hypothetical protein CMN60_21310 [Sphingobium sp.]|nr:hypothetical protein [Sphingobium sp.]MBS50171.1 hypothetical protein [Sphingobium sp.]|tara:strand:+ start:37885 stop:38172 length:288 start_codon:yes stop_codon:yes gene_type:complete